MPLFLVFAWLTRTGITGSSVARDTYKPDLPGATLTLNGKAGSFLYCCL